MTDYRHIQGFTIVELMIATTVFSIILMLSLVGFLQIGQLFYKGVNITRTTDTAKQVITSLKTDIAFDNSSFAISPNSETLTVSGPNGTKTLTRWWFCTGSNRYSYIKNQLLDREAEANEMKTQPNNPNGWYQYGLLKDRVDVSSGCPYPFSGASQLDPTTVTELLGDKMRLSKFDISTITNKLYTLNVKIAYGEDEVLDNASTPEAKCKSGSNYSRYCFVMEIRTVVRQGIQP